MKRPLPHFFLIFVLLFIAANGDGQSNLVANLRLPSRTAEVSPPVAGFAAKRNSEKRSPGEKRADVLTKYEQTCAVRFFAFCDYLLSPPDIIIDSISYSGSQKKDEIVMQRERAEDTARIKIAVLRYTVVPEPTNTNDSFHFSQEELSDQDYRKLEKAFSTIEQLLDTCYNSGGIPLRLVPLRLYDDAAIRSQLAPGQLSSTFLLRRGKETLAVLLFTPRSRMTSTRPPRICGWSVDFRHSRMIFHHLDGTPRVLPTVVDR